jgi:hypothetical protein
MCVCGYAELVPPLTLTLSSMCVRACIKPSTPSYMALRWPMAISPPRHFRACFYMQHAHMRAMHGTHRSDSKVHFPMLAGMLPVRWLEYKPLPPHSSMSMYLNPTSGMRVCMCIRPLPPSWYLAHGHQPPQALQDVHIGTCDGTNAWHSQL